MLAYFARRRDCDPSGLIMRTRLDDPRPLSKQAEHVLRWDLRSADADSAATSASPVGSQRIQILDAIPKGLDPPTASKPRSPRHSASRIVVNAGRRALRVMRHHRGDVTASAPEPAGQHLALEIVRVHVDHAQNQIISIEIDRASRCRGTARCRSTTIMSPCVTRVPEQRFVRQCPEWHW